MKKTVQKNNPSSFSLPVYLVMGLCFLSLLIRFWRITDNQFLFYDEGMYLGYNRNFLVLVAQNFPHSLGEFFTILGVMFKMALTTAKALWFFILNLRVFILSAEAMYFARVISALAGVATIVLVYCWVNRRYGNKRLALLSALILAFLPSHIFYSRLGMQESLSTLLFFVSVYLYTLNRACSWRDFLAAFILSCVFFTNYRMIIAPFLIAVLEFALAFSAKEKINWQKFLSLAGVFYLIVFVVGSLYGGINREVTFGWMFHQAQDASGKFDPVNFLSYPYYTLVLEGGVVGLFFWANLRFIKARAWGLLIPFVLVLAQMGLFSFAAEKGARYICVVLPFMAIASAISTEEFLKAPGKLKAWVNVLMGLLLATMLYKALPLMNANTDYQKAAAFVIFKDPQALSLSTQPLVEDLYAPRENRIIALPKDVASLVDAYKKGARYLILDPQAFISWTKDGNRFSFELIDFLELIRHQVKPVIVFDHLQKPLLERFVLDHNENLARSTVFLAKGDDSLGKIFIYDLNDCLPVLKEAYK